MMMMMVMNASFTAGISIREAEAVSGTGHFNVRAQGSVAGSLQAPQLKMSPSVSVNLVEALL